MPLVWSGSRRVIVSGRPLRRKQLRNRSGDLAVCSGEAPSSPGVVRLAMRGVRSSMPSGGMSLAARGSSSEYLDKRMISIPARNCRPSSRSTSCCSIRARNGYRPLSGPTNGAHLQVPRAVALLTTGYAIGQILGPVVSRPLLSAGYGGPLLLGGAIIAAAALAGLAVRFRFPHHVGASSEPSRSVRRGVARPDR